MRSSGRRSPIRLVVALLLALLASVRGGGLALACDLTPIGESHSAPMADHDMPMQHDAPEHGSHGNESCDSPEDIQQCAAMAACAPAIATTPRDDPSLAAERSAHVVVTDSPSLVDRSPDPPPPRA